MAKALDMINVVGFESDEPTVAAKEHENIIIKLLGKITGVSKPTN